MAVEGIQQRLPGLVAGADLSTKQFYFVKITTAFTVDVCSAVTDIPIGVLQNKPASGEEASVCVFGLSKVNSDAALAVGNLIGTAVDGQAAPYVNATDTTKYIVGQVIQASTAAGGYASAFINITPNRGA